LRQERDSSHLTRRYRELESRDLSSGHEYQPYELNYRGASWWD